VQLWYVRGVASAPPKRQPRGTRRREAILRAALRVIGERGVGATTHRAIAEAAGVPVATTTYYFASLDELLEQALRLFVAEEVARLGELTQALAAAGPVAPERAAAVFADEIAGFVPHDPEQVAQLELYVEACRRPGLRAAATECLDAYVGVADAAMRAAGAREPGEAARAAVALVDGMGLVAVARGGARPADEVRRALLALFRGFRTID
jgi:TetR/AcrR family transcriptional regulator, regulator of biofilm formation and stress response